MKWIYDLSHEQLITEVTAAGLKKFVVDQVFQWLYLKNIQDMEQWSNISKENRLALAYQYNTGHNTILDIKSDDQGTQKLLLELHDKEKIEAVSIKERDHYTFCLSTQVGCALGCKFCATGKLGFKRNLSAGEILCQILLLKKNLQTYTGKINLVFMGMGEPLLNYENLSQALHIITAEKGICISPRHITLSTAGILKRLQQFEFDFPNIKISFSLNAPDTTTRQQLMPITHKESLASLLNHFRSVSRKHRITFEYVLLKGVNDSLEHAAKLSVLLKGIACKINLIPYNENNGLPYKTPDTKTVDSFSQYLYSRGYTVVVRWSKGRDIKSACGQLAAQALILLPVPEPESYPLKNEKEIQDIR